MDDDNSKRKSRKIQGVVTTIAGVLLLWYEFPLLTNLQLWLIIVQTTWLVGLILISWGLRRLGVGAMGTALLGAILFTYSVVGVYFGWGDFGPRACTIAGCPSPYSIEFISSFAMHYFSGILTIPLGIVLMFYGLRESSSSMRMRHGFWCISIGVLTLMVLISPILIRAFFPWLAPSGPSTQGATTVTTTITTMTATPL